MYFSADTKNLSSAKFILNRPMLKAIQQIKPFHGPCNRTNDWRRVAVILDDLTQVDLKPAGQPEQASLNQCQLIAQNWCSAHALLMVEIRFLCYVIDTRTVIGPCSHVTSC